MLATDTSVYLFIYFREHVCAHLDDVWNLKQRGKIPSFWGMSSSVCETRHGTDICTIFTRMHAHMHRGKHARPPSSSRFFPLSLALPFSPGRSRVPRMCHQTLVSIWTWGKKEILDRKVYEKRTLGIFDILRAAASKRVGWRGKETQLQDACLFICCLFSLPSFREMEASARPQLTHPCIGRLGAGPWKRNRNG